jgi:preprotein translocase SecE subunit
MNMPKEQNNKTWKAMKYILGTLGILSIVIAILTVSNVMYDILPKVGYKGTFGDKQKVIISLSSSILGILLLFIAFSKQIDRFFNVLERKELKLSRDEAKSGLSIEMLFFLTIAGILTILAVLLGIDKLGVETELPLIGKYSETFILVSLIVLAIISIIVAFNEIISRSVKEMKKVHWPTGKQMSQYSAQVFSFVIFFSLLFLAFDFLVGNGLAGLERLLS